MSVAAPGALCFCHSHRPRVSLPKQEEPPLNGTALPQISEQPVSRILSRFAPETTIPLGAPSLARSSNLPGGFLPLGACARRRGPASWRAGPARTATARGPSRCFLPIWSCSVWGLPCLLRYRRSGALLPHLFTLTFCRSRDQRRYLLCGTGRLRAFTPGSRTLSGTLPCGVRTFLSRPALARSGSGRPAARSLILRGNR